MVKVKDEKELGQALKEQQDTIEIEGDLTKKILKIKATGKIAWAVAIGAIGVAVVAILTAPATGGTHGVVGVMAAPVAVGILGAGTTVAAIAIAIGAGGVGALNRLRSYKVEKLGPDHIILKK